jgi:hypothetical protein
MTKKHYEAIARIVSAMLRYEAQNPAEEARIRDIACRLADYFQSENSKFNRARFIVSCGLS